MIFKKLMGGEKMGTELGVLTRTQHMVILTAKFITAMY